MTAPKNAWSDENDLRWYTFKDTDYLSVTSMRKVLGMPYNLHRWVVKQVLEAVQRDPALLVPGTRKGKPETPANVRGRIMEKGMEERDRSAERGTQVHGFIANGTSQENIPAELKPYVDAYASAVIALGIRPLLSERQVFSDKWGYAGSFDLLASVKAKHNKVTVIDLKTGTSTYAEHALQGKAYLEADFIGEDDKVDVDATAIFKRAKGVAILHLHPGIGQGWTYHDVRMDKALDQGFKALAILSRWMVKFPTIESLEE